MHALRGFLIAWSLAGGSWAGPTPYGKTPGARCDLRSGSMVGTSRCLDPDSLGGSTLRVPLATTRISTDGLVLCARPAPKAGGTDIVYIVDQSGSMSPYSFVLRGPDTLVLGSCIYGGGVRVPFRQGQLVEVDTLFRDYARLYCDLANDPFNRRAEVVQQAVALQSSLTKGSWAGWVSFGDRYRSTNMVDLDNAIARNQLLQSIQLDRMGGTNYRDPIGWARVMLQGGHQANNPKATIAASPSPRKAILMISDGDPTDVFHYLEALDPRAVISDTAGVSWVVDADTAVPVYGIYLSPIPRNGSALQKLSLATGGQFYIIPPNDPDSLNHVVARIVGSLAQTPVADSFRIVNRTNGQISTGISGSPEGGGLRIRLDSILALVAGKNELDLGITQGSISKTVRWNVVVGDSGAVFSSLGTDSLLIATCSDPSRIRLRPESDSSRNFADDRDSVLRVWLEASNAGQSQLPVSISTRLSGDELHSSLPVSAGSGWARLRSDAPLFWRLGTTNRNDAVLQTATGWDTARVLYHTPRDPRDSAVGSLALVRAKPAMFWLSPDTLRAMVGRIGLFLLDSLRTTDTITAILFHRSTDSVRVVLKRRAGPLFVAEVDITQGRGVLRGDSVLQTGPLRRGNADSVFAKCGGLRDSAILAAISPRLRFILPSGMPVDTLPGEVLAIGATASLACGLFLGDSLLAISDTMLVTAPAWLQIGSTTSCCGGGKFPLVGGRAMLAVTALAPGQGGAIVLRNIPWGDSLVWSPLSVLAHAVPPPDSAVLDDLDGDGGVDHIRVFFREAWNPQNTFVFPWPSGGQNLDISGAILHPSADSLALIIDLGSSQNLGFTRWAGLPQPGLWSALPPGAIRSFPVREAVPPIPKRASLVRGAAWDTLIVWASEGLRPGDLVAGADLVWRSSPVQNLMGASSVLWNDADQSLRLVFPAQASDRFVQPGDSVRFSPSGAVRDSLGNTPGVVAPSVLVEGLDRSPVSARVTDSDADGRADRIVVSFRAPPRVVDRFRFRWPDGNGGIEERSVEATAATVDSSGCEWTFSVAPFAYGSTSCPVAGCLEFGSMSTGKFGDTLRMRFDLVDGVVPVATRAVLSFAAADGVPDTLRIHVSESVTLSVGTSWVDWGRPSWDSLGSAVVHRGVLSQDPWISYLVDSSFHGGSGDSVRLGAWSRSALQDAGGNSPGRFAHWVPIELGELAGKLASLAWPPTIRYTGWSIPPQEPPLSVFVRSTSRDLWRLTDGAPPLQQVSHYLGVRILSNTDLDAGWLYVYDHQGIFVASLDLSQTLAMLRDGVRFKTLRGDFELLVAWNGKDAHERVVPSGPYLARLVAWRNGGKSQVCLNRIFHLGWVVP